MITEAMLREAAAELNDAMLRSLPHEDECEYEFSLRFERRMKRLIRRVDHPVRYRVMRKTAAAVLVIILCAAMLLAVSPNARAAFFGWVAEQYEAFTEYYFKGECEKDSEHVEYTLPELPDGFEEWMRSDMRGKTTICYKNLYTGEIVNFSYSTGNVTNPYYLDNTSCVIEDVTVNDDNGHVYLSNEPSIINTIVWIDDETDTLFSISAVWNRDELVYYAENIKVNE